MSSGGGGGAMSDLRSSTKKRVYGDRCAAAVLVSFALVLNLSD